MIAVLSLAGCKADPPSNDPMVPDASMGGSLLPPQVDAPSETPLGTVAIEGSAAGANRIVIKNAETDVATVNSLLPGGDFCVDTPLEEGTTSAFLVYGVAEDGSISVPSEVEITHDSAAPTPAKPTCTMSGECDPTESCENGTDDNCNGLMDECDPGCNGCTDDNLEPNDTPFSVPMMTPGDYDALKICPCRTDWFAFDVAANGTINVDVNFNVGEVDIDLKLYTPENAEQRVEPPEAASTGTSGTESIDFTSTTGGRYYLQIYSFPPGGDRQGTYDMSID